MHSVRRRCSGLVIIPMIVLLTIASSCGGEPGATEVAEPPFTSPLPTSVQTVASPSARPGRIAFHSDRDGDFDIYSMKSDGADRQQLTNAPGDDLEPEWSPDGSLIAFSSQRDGNHEIYVMDRDGANQRQLTDDAATDWGPTWSPDGAQIAFASERNGTMQLFVIKSDGTDQRRLQPEDQTAGWAPDWSPTGDEIVFVSDRTGESNLYLLRVSSGEVTQLTFSEYPDERPAWSPDGEQIVYMSAKERTALFDPDEIRVIPRTGGEGRTLTDNLSGDITPAWSPDGQQIVFSSSRDGGWNLFIMWASGESEGVRALTSDSDWNRGPSWGP